MMQNIIIRNKEDLGELLDLIHDQFFNVELIEPNDKLKELRIMIEVEDVSQSQYARKGFFIKEIKKPVYECYLIIKNVINYSIVDTEKIGFYDINKILFDDKRNAIIIETCIPIHFEILVSAFELVFENTERIIKYNYKRKIFW
jgi:hypothetical protein